METNCHELDDHFTSLDSAHSAPEVEVSTSPRVNTTVNRRSSRISGRTRRVVVADKRNKMKSKDVRSKGNKKGQALSKKRNEEFSSSGSSFSSCDKTKSSEPVSSTSAVGGSRTDTYQFKHQLNHPDYQNARTAHENREKKKQERQKLVEENEKITRENDAIRRDNEVLRSKLQDEMRMFPWVRSDSSSSPTDADVDSGTVITGRPPNFISAAQALQSILNNPTRLPSRM